MEIIKDATFRALHATDTDVLPVIPTTLHAPVKGAFAYNSVTNLPNYANGAIWQPIGTITTEDEGVVVGTVGGVNVLNFVGAGVTATGVGATATVTIPGGVAGINVQDEGVTVGTPNGITNVNFVGGGVTATAVGANATVTIPAAGAGSLGYSYFSGNAPGDYAATIAVGAAMDFPTIRATGGVTAITRTGAGTFQLADIGTYDVSWLASITEPGQLQVTTTNLGILAYTTTGRATGTALITNRVFVTTAVINDVLSIRNPAGNAAALTVTPNAGGASAASTSLVIVRIA